MAEQDDLRYWLIISATKYLKSKDLHKLLQRYTVEQLCCFSASELSSIGFTPSQIKNILQPDETFIKRVIQWAQCDENHVITYSAGEYPHQLKEISSPPLILYGRGDIGLLVKKQVAIVGSRNASLYGLDNAYYFAAELARCGFVITSGFAAGVDGKAHQGALFSQGKTIAVLGTGVDVVYPKRHQALAADIVRTGLLLSEFPPETPPRAQHFPRRNRIISGLSHGVLVVEAAIKSGSLITAQYALEQNKDVFAIPHSIHDPRSRGCHILIKQGAKLTETVADIVEEFPVDNSSLNANVELSNNLSFSFDDEKDEKKSTKNFTNDPLLVNLTNVAISIDELVTRSQMPVDVVLTRLLELELEGQVATVSGGYVRTRRR